MIEGRTPDTARAALPAYHDLGPDPEPLGERFEILLERDVAARRPASPAVVASFPVRVPSPRERAPEAA